MSRPMLVLMAFLIAGLIAACGPREPGPTILEVVMSGENQVPPVETEAFGTANVTVLGNVMTVDGEWEGFDIAGPGVHIHGPAAADENAGVVFPLVFDNEARTFGGTFSMSEEQRNWFADGLLYINAHSEANPAGEIRGQITP